MSFGTFFNTRLQSSKITEAPFSKLGNFLTICLYVGSSDFSDRNSGFDLGSLSVQAFNTFNISKNIHDDSDLKKKYFFYVGNSSKHANAPII